MKRESIGPRLHVYVMRAGLLPSVCLLVCFHHERDGRVWQTANSGDTDLCMYQVMLALGYQRVANNTLFPSFCVLLVAKNPCRQWKTYATAIFSTEVCT